MADIRDESKPAPTISDNLKIYVRINKRTLAFVNNKSTEKKFDSL